MSDSSDDELPKKRHVKIESERRKLKKTKFTKKYFIDDAAESGDEEESGADSDYEAEYEEAIKLRKELPERKTLYENLSPEELAEKYEKKVEYQKVNYITKEISVVSKQQELPSINDPKLWQVFCRPGKARELVINLLAKALSLTDSRLAIFSAFASNCVNDCIYIEAFHKLDVLMAIKGMHHINEHKIVVVPISEMSDVFAMDTVSKFKPVPGEFVRVRFGKYKEDLAQIIRIEEHLGKAIVRIVPRLESAENKKLRPPAKLFNPSDHACEKKRDPVSQEFFYTYKNEQFHNGFIYKTLAFRSLNFREVRPTLSETNIFNDTKIEMVLKPKAINFHHGDKVTVVAGDSKGLTGSVESSQRSMVSIIPFIEELCDQKMDFPMKELSKFFDIGDHVKVIEGRYVGVTGMVVLSKGSSVDIITDISKSLITVLSNDLQLSEEISSGQDKAENYRINDIVVMKNETNFGIVTAVSAGGVNVVLDTCEYRNLWNHEIIKKYSPFHFNALDRDKNKLCFNDMVRIVFGKHPHAGKHGSVKNAFRGVLFLHVRDSLETMVISVKSSYCLLQGQTTTQSGVSAPRDTFLNSTVRLKSGPYRGSTGKVVEATESRFKVELSTISKLITIDAAACEKLDECGDVMAIQNMKRTPAANSPAYTPHEVSSPWDTPAHSRRF